MTVAMTTARGSAPKPCASDTAMGTISAVVAVLDIKLVIVQVMTKMTTSRISGWTSLPIAPISVSAIRLPAPVCSSAVASASEPPKRNTVLRSMDFSASFSLMTPVRIRMMAPTDADTCSLMPICFSNTIARMAMTSTASDIYCFHLGTSE